MQEGLRSSKDKIVEIKTKYTLVYSLTFFISFISFIISIYNVWIIQNNKGIWMKTKLGAYGMMKSLSYHNTMAITFGVIAFITALFGLYIYLKASDLTGNKESFFDNKENIYKSIITILLIIIIVMVIMFKQMFDKKVVNVYRSIESAELFFSGLSQIIDSDDYTNSELWLLSRSGFITRRWLQSHNINSYNMKVLIDTIEDFDQHLFELERLIESDNETDIDDKEKEIINLVNQERMKFSDMSNKYNRDSKWYHYRWYFYIIK